VELEERHFRMFKMWGIRSLEIADLPGGSDSAGMAEVRGAELPEAVAREVSDLFRQAQPDHPVMVVLRRRAVTALMRREEQR
jgi:hypothetical protein